MIRAVAFTLALAAGSLATVAVAQVSIAIEVQKRVATTDARGRPTVQLTTIDRVLPGDEVLYTVRLTNAGTQPAEHVRFVTPIPAEMSYVDGSAQGAGAAVQFSIDRGQAFAPAAQLFVTEADGRRRPARGSDYTHIQWTLAAPIAAAGATAATYRATVR